MGHLDSRFTNLELGFPSVINSIDRPISAPHAVARRKRIRLVHANHLTAVKLQVPLPAPPRFFVVPPIARTDVRSLFGRNGTADFTAAGMNKVLACKQNSGRGGW